jgi:HK97 family phage major capsid protein
MRGKLQAKVEELQKRIDVALADAATAIEGDDFAKATDLHNSVEGLKEQRDTVQKQLDLLPKEEKAPEPTGKAATIPFATDEPSEEAEEDSFAKGVYTIRFGDVDEAVKAVAKDLYGKDYMEKRANQMGAFAKYLRTGEQNSALNELIFTPDVIKSEVRAGYSVAEIKANKAVQQEGSLELGGALVPEDFRLEVIRRLMGMTIVRGRARQINTVRDKVEFPSLEGGDSRHTSAVRVTWVDEVPSSATGAQTNATFAMLNIPVHTVMARTDLSRNLLEDAGVDVVSLIAELFSEEMALDEDEKFLIGTGGGTPKGVLGNRSGAEYSPYTGVGVVNSGAAAALTGDGLIDLVYDLDAQYRSGAVLVGTKGTHKMVRKLKDGNGDYLWERGLKLGEPPTLLGYAFYENEVLNEVLANTHPIVFGDWGRGYLIADRVGMTVERIIDTDTVGKNKVAIFARRRLGGQVIRPYAFRAQKVSA